MRTLLLGILIGAAVFALVAWMGGWLLPADDRAAGHGGTVSRPAPEPAAPPPLADRRDDSARLEGTAPTADPAQAPFAVGEAWLRVGEGYVFGEAAARRGDAPDHYDVYCQDIRHGASLSCPHGAVPAKVPYSAVGMPADPAAAAALLQDAPEDLSLRNLWLKSRSAADAPGVGFVRAREGPVYKLHLATLEPDPDALRRRVRIRYGAVPVREGGGEFHLPTTDKEKPVPIETRQSIRKALAYAQSLRGASFINHLRGSYETLSSLEPEVILTKERHLALDQPLASKIVLPRRGAVFASQGIAPRGHVVLDSYAGVGSAGDMAGRVDVESYGYVYVDGDLTGTVNIESYATVIIEGDLRGLLKVRSYTTLLLRGRVLGTLDCHGSCWSTFYLDGFWTQADLEALGEGFGSVTLHVRDSDLAQGKHGRIGSWREVIVGARVWAKLGG